MDHSGSNGIEGCSLYGDEVLNVPKTSTTGAEAVAVIVAAAAAAAAAAADPITAVVVGVGGVVAAAVVVWPSPEQLDKLQYVNFKLLPVILGDVTKRG